MLWIPLLSLEVPVLAVAAAKPTVLLVGLPLVLRPYPRRFAFEA